MAVKRAGKRVQRDEKCQTSFRLSQRCMDLMYQIADQQGMSLSTVVEQAIREIALRMNVVVDENEGPIPSLIIRTAPRKEA